MYIHKKVKHASKKIQHGKLKIYDEVLENNNKITCMKWFS